MNFRLAWVVIIDFVDEQGRTGQWAKKKSTKINLVNQLSPNISDKVTVS